MPWIAAGGAVLGGLIGAGGSKKAAKQQAAATDRATAETRRQFDVTRGDLAPWRGVGEEALYTMADLLGLGTKASLTGMGKPVMPTPEGFYRQSITGYQTREPNWMVNDPGGQTPVYGRTFDQPGYESALDKYHRDVAAWQSGQAGPSGSLLKPFTLEDFEKDPGYQFRKQQGSEAVLSDASARGLRLSPATQKALMRFNSELASQEFGNAFSRDDATKSRIYNMLAGASGAGQTATTATGQFGANASGNIADLITQGGNARAAGTVGAFNALAGGLSQGANIWSQQRMLDEYLSNFNRGGWGPASQSQMQDMMGAWY